MLRSTRLRNLFVCVLLLSGCFCACTFADDFDGKFFSGQGDSEYLELLDICRRTLECDSEMLNINMLYQPRWNGFVLAEFWGAWWIQNSYGTTYAALPIYTEPYATFVKNAQDLWYRRQGNGKRKDKNGYVGPVGSLCDCASNRHVVYRQGDGNHKNHDWAFGFTTAGVVMQAELLLVSRNMQDIDHYLPLLEKSVEFIQSRYDPNTGCFLVGAAGNLLAPSYAGCKQKDGTFSKAYLAEISVNYIAALDRVIELEKMVSNKEKIERYSGYRDNARAGLKNFVTDEGYFIKSLDPDGTKHGVYGAAKHGYFESSVNHDAICFRVVDDRQARKIYAKIDSIPQLRPYGFIVANYPGLDDMYVEPPTGSGIWQPGWWVNGGNWSTCEGRIMMAYYRLEEFDDALRSIKQWQRFANEYQADNPFSNYGATTSWYRRIYYNIYDSYGPPAAFVRGLFEYIYKADSVTLVPHIPEKITRLKQKFPIRFGDKKLYISTYGNGPISSVKIDGKRWKDFDEDSVLIKHDKLPAGKAVKVQIAMAGQSIPQEKIEDATAVLHSLPAKKDDFWKADWPVTSDLPLYIGANMMERSVFDGKLAALRMYNKALDDRQIEQLSKAKLSDPAFIEHCAAYWLFEYGQDLYHLTAGKLRRPVKYLDTPYGKAVDLGSSYQYLIGTNTRNLAFLDNNYTLSAMVYPQKEAYNMTIFDKSWTNENYRLTINNGRLSAQTRVGKIVSDNKVPLNQWTHVSFVAQGGRQLKLYIDGKLVKTANAGDNSNITAFNTLRDNVYRIRKFYLDLKSQGLADTYIAGHAKTAVNFTAAMYDRYQKTQAGVVFQPNRNRLAAADMAFVRFAGKLCHGLIQQVEQYKTSDEENEKKIYQLWQNSGS